MSANPTMLRKLVRDLEKIDQSLGNGKKSRLIEEEKPLIKMILVQKAISNPGNKPSNKIDRQFRLNSAEAAELLTVSELPLLGSSKYISLIILR